MLEPYFLTYVPSRKGLAKSRYLLRTPTGETEATSLDALSKLEIPITTHDCPLLVEEFRERKLPFPPLIEIEEALKLSVGIAKGDGGDKYWNFWKRLKSQSNGQNRGLYQKVFQLSINCETVDELDSILVEASLELSDLWEATISLLQEKSEFNRFTDIEIPVSQILLKRQFNGIKVCEEELSKFIKDAKNQKYTAYLKIAEKLNISPTGLNIFNVAQYFSLTDFATKYDPKLKGDLEDQLKLANPSSQFAQTFLEYVNSERDLQILTRLISFGDRVYPRFATIGSITSRAFVTFPLLQQLRRKYRKVISADDGKNLIYLDYGQFEPGIVAHLSNDAELINAYNSEDLYESLSIAVFGHTMSRDLCKKIFLSFIYGMSDERIALLVSEPSTAAEELAELRGKIAQFFSRFEMLTEFKSLCAEELEKNGYVSSPNGNRRNRIRRGKLHHKEVRWAFNHVVQGTASLIFKEALIKIVEEIGSDAILLPMHDAVLLQVAPEDSHETQALVKKIMSESFKLRCPTITPKVSIEDFS